MFHRPAEGLPRHSTDSSVVFHDDLVYPIDVHITSSAFHPNSDFGKLVRVLQGRPAKNGLRDPVEVRHGSKENFVEIRKSSIEWPELELKDRVHILAKL
jgi:hypothetical protein